MSRCHQGDDLGSDRAALAAYLTDRWLPIQEGRLKTTTFKSYEDNVRLHVIPHIGRIKLNKLQAGDLDALYAAAAQDRSPQRRRRAEPADGSVCPRDLEQGAR